ncbi:MAG: hypothetical protein WAN06_08665 [Candidatus Sulfotelmatobacter sp.]
MRRLGLPPLILFIILFAGLPAFAQEQSAQPASGTRLPILSQI